MTDNERHLTQQFYNWEIRGRGWIRYPQRIDLEPPFRPIAYSLPKPRVRNAGQMPTLLSSLTSALTDLFKPAPPEVLEIDEAEPQPKAAGDREPIVEIRTSLPPKIAVTKELLVNLVQSFSICRRAIALEYVATSHGIVAQWAAAESDAETVTSRCQSWLPDAVFTHGSDELQNAFTEAAFVGIAEFGLDFEFLVPLTTFERFDPDPLLSLIGALGTLQEREGAVYQVLFQPVRHRWAESMRACVAAPDGSPLFTNAPELADRVTEKIESPLFAVAVRLAVGTLEETRARELVRQMSQALSVFGSRESCNRLVPLLRKDPVPPEGYFESILGDIIARRTRRSGMLLNLDELVSLAHLPSVSVREPKLVRQVRKTKAAPAYLLNGSFLLGENEHAGKVNNVTLSSEQRVRHMHVLGVSGTGKSTLLLKSIVQDIHAGHGVAVLDPDGDLVDKILGYIPDHRVKDVILFDPSDEEYPVGFNILSAKSELERTLLASDLCAVFRRQSTSWGDQMTAVLSNAILAFLESPSGGTLADLRRFLLEDGFRKAFLKTVHDPEVIYFWERHFPQVSGKPQASIVTRLGTFLSQKALRYMVCQKESRLDFATIVDTGKIFLAKLSQGLIGRENAHLFGALLVGKFQQTAIARQAQAVEQRRDFWLYIDECHNFVTPSMTDILSGTRKYRLGLILAHHELRQLLSRDADVGSAVIAHPATRVCFRLSEEDARKMAEGFSFFDAGDLVNLEIGHAVGRIEVISNDFNLRIPMLEAAAAGRNETVFHAVRANTRALYAQPREQVIAEYEKANAWPHEREQREPPAPKPVKNSVRQQPTLPKPPAAEQPQVVSNDGRKETPTEIVPAPPEMPDESPLKSTAPTEHSEDPPKLADILAETPSGPAPETQDAEKPEQRPQGRGGLQHQYLQRYLKEIGEQFGYRATIEKTIAGGAIDVLLERDGKTIALEISITTGSEHEMQRLEHRLASGFNSVIAIGNDARKLARFQKAATAHLSPEQLKQVTFHTVESFIASLAGATATPSKGKRKVRGYDITIATGTVKSATGQADQVVHDAVAKALKRLKPKR